MHHRIRRVSSLGDQTGQSPSAEEQAFAKLKAVLRARAARTIDALWSALAGVVEWFPPNECANYFRNAGYSQSA
jgi:hypothetical protein